MNTDLFLKHAICFWDCFSTLPTATVFFIHLSMQWKSLRDCKRLENCLRSYIASLNIFSYLPFYVTVIPELSKEMTNKQTWTDFVTAIVCILECFAARWNIQASFNAQSLPVTESLYTEKSLTERRKKVHLKFASWFSWSSEMKVVKMAGKMEIHLKICLFYALGNGRT